ncbi:hypothetical protein BGZ65_009263 [Modicella reniformis]|uniref:Rieske domain-containing protein n=1 Tax=Modicella reniformis TaxID=1440133 RepID=A0A9P6LTJ6_9FUNG|nr:hypothetical protein BGZ65_009263 [Modicella reniformis]
MSDTTEAATPVQSTLTSSADSPGQSQARSSAASIAPENTSISVAASDKAVVGSSPAAAIDTVTTSLSNLTVNDSTSKHEDIKKTEVPKEPEEELSPEEAGLRAKGLKSTHRPGFYIHIDSPKRLRIQTKDKAFDLDRYCPHANADMLKWGVLRADLTLRCGVHYWGFDLVKNGQCIAHPDETLNACPVADPELEW